MARTARRTALTVLAMTSLLVGVLTACSSAEEPVGPVSPTPTSTATTTQSSPSPSPTPSAEADSDKPERPAAMDKRDAEGAAAAAEYFIALYPYIMKTGDTDEFKAMSHKACGYCTATLENEKWLRDNDANFSGGEMTTSLEKTYQRDTVTGLFPLDIRVIQKPILITDSVGSEVDSVKQSVLIARVEVGLRDGEWVIATVTHKPVD